MSASSGDSDQKFLRGFDRCTSCLCRPFGGDAQGAVQRLWGLCLFSMTILFIAACMEAKLMQSTYGSAPIVIAAIWTALVQIFMGVVGTFVLRRFPTEFSVGFFLGLLVIVAQQNFILTATFLDPTFNMLSEQKSSKFFAFLILITGIIYIAFAMMLTHFRHEILLAPEDVKSVISALGSMSQDGDVDNNTKSASGAPASEDYSKFQDPE